MWLHAWHGRSLSRCLWCLVSSYNVQCYLLHKASGLKWKCVWMNRSVVPQRDSSMALLVIQYERCYTCTETLDDKSSLLSHDNIIKTRQWSEIHVHITHQTTRPVISQMKSMRGSVSQWKISVGGSWLSVILASGSYTGLTKYYVPKFDYLYALSIFFVTFSAMVSCIISYILIFNIILQLL